MYPGNAFVLNLLAEGQAPGADEAFPQALCPGEDRFAGIETETAENGARF
jgi:flavin reductase (DIM6/NTAB) family NADH-FMN oxidoreductase RutF